MMMQMSERNLHITAPAFAEPLRKKKIINPLTTKKQYERKLRRLEREISKLESIEPKLKPILELHLQPFVKKDIEARKRNETDQTNHKLLNAYLKIWSIYKTLETETELSQIRCAARAQERALSLLKRDYPQLYLEAIQIDPNLIPYTVTNIKKDTPPVESYNCPDGKEYDTTKQWKL
ncbi:39S ribosomal protein L40, mitochondrial [Blomia tropicalis]|nr:39S ribosomal protein L40, mitochondrial [Blomia tropicalis]